VSRADASALLEARAVRRVFGAHMALAEASFSLRAGEVLALLGPSGSGKSTLLRVLAGLETLDGGQVFLNEELIANSRTSMPAEKRGIGMVFQDFALFPHLDVLANVSFGLQHLDRLKRADIAQMWLDRVGLSHRAHAFPHHLSGGEQQRVALARALAPGPKVVLMDEPFSGLDLSLRSSLQEATLLALKQANVAAIIVSHDTEEALAIADTVAVMDAGRLIQHGTPQDVYSNPVSLNSARALGPVWTVMAHANGGWATHPLGRFATALEGSVVIAARPEFTTPVLEADGPLTVKDVRGVGATRAVKLAGQGFEVSAKLPVEMAPSLGQTVGLRFGDPGQAMIFPAIEPPAR
jgi:iron(III) transport system ATP-binding protein